MNTLVIARRSENITVEFPEPLKFKKMALQEFEMEVSWDNISEKYKNNRFKYYDGNTWSDVILNDGFYGIERLNIRIKYILFNRENNLKEFQDYESPIQFGEVEEENKFSIHLKENYKIDLTEGNFHKILGFEPKIYEDFEQVAKYTANIEHKSEDIYVHCNIVEGMQINNLATDVIHTFINTNKPGTKIVHKFDKPIFYNVKNEKGVQHITLKITDEDGTLLNLKNTKVKYKFITIDETEDYLEKIYKLLLNK